MGMIYEGLIRLHLLLQKSWCRTSYSNRWQILAAGASCGACHLAGVVLASRLRLASKTTSSWWHHTSRHGPALVSNLSEQPPHERKWRWVLAHVFDGITMIHFPESYTTNWISLTSRPLSWPLSCEITCCRVNMYMYVTCIKLLLIVLFITYITC